MMRPQGLSFCVITGGHRPDRMEALIQSIIRLNIRHFEVLVCGNYRRDDRIIYFEEKELAAKAEVCKMRNINAANATYDTVVILDDDVEFAPDWWENIREEKSFDLAGCQGLDPNGRRWWDYQRVERGNPMATPILLDYSETHPDAYISGYFMMFRWEVWNAVKFDEARRNYQHDDVDFCHRAMSRGYSLRIFPKARVTHHVDPRGREESERARTQFIAGHHIEGASEEQLAAQHMMAKNFSKAIALYKKLAADGAFQNIYNLAWCYEQAGALDEALYCYRKSIAVGGRDDRQASAHYHIGGILLSSGRYDEAQDHFRAVLSCVPDHQKAAAALTALHERKETAK